MNKLIRLYNQNRALVIITICIIALIIIIIQVLNSIVKKENEAKALNITNDTNSSTNLNSTTISESNISAITGETVKNNKEDTEVIKQFVENCNNGKVEQAYDMLTEDCKKLIYPSVEDFKTGYIDRIFYMNRMYTLENWHTNANFNTYYIKYIEDILASGNANSNSNIGDYITVTRTGKINTSSFIGSQDINKSKSKKDITITINKMYMYMDYTILDLKLKNNTNGIVCIDTKKEIDTTYLYDTNGVKYTAFLNENSIEELEIRRNMEQNISIKFNKIYNPERRELSGLILKDVVVNYEKYLQENEKKQTVIFDIEI